MAKKGCIGCGVGLAYKAVDGLCNTCLRARELYEGGIPPLKPRLKVYVALIHFPNDPRIPKIEITLLDTNQAEVGPTVRQILQADGYDPGEAMMTVDEIEGPFEAGFVIARHGG